MTVDTDEFFDGVNIELTTNIDTVQTFLRMTGNFSALEPGQ